MEKNRKHVRIRNQIDHRKDEKKFSHKYAV